MLRSTRFGLDMLAHRSAQQHVDVVRGDRVKSRILQVDQVQRAGSPVFKVEQVRRGRSRTLKVDEFGAAGPRMLKVEEFRVARRRIWVDQAVASRQCGTGLATAGGREEGRTGGPCAGSRARSPGEQVRRLATT